MNEPSNSSPSDATPPPPPPFTPPPPPAEPAAPPAAAAPQQPVYVPSAAPPGKNSSMPWILGGCGCLILILIIAAIVGFSIYRVSKKGAELHVQSEQMAGNWISEQPLGDKNGSGGVNRWTYSLSPDGYFAGKAERLRSVLDLADKYEGQWSLSGTTLKLAYDDGISREAQVTSMSPKWIEFVHGKNHTSWDRADNFIPVTQKERRDRLERMDDAVRRAGTYQGYYMLFAQSLKEQHPIQLRFAHTSTGPIRAHLENIPNDGNSTELSGQTLMPKEKLKLPVLILKPVAGQNFRSPALQAFDSGVLELSPSSDGSFSGGRDSPPYTQFVVSPSMELIPQNDEPSQSSTSKSGWNTYTNVKQKLPAKLQPNFVPFSFDYPHERRQIAQRFRSEGEGEAARIAGNKERDLNEIQSTAYRRVQEIRGEADGKATEIYARAYTQTPQAAEFYAFLKSMETYRKVLTKDSTLVLSTDSDLFSLLKRAGAKPGPPPPRTPQP